MKKIFECVSKDKCIFKDVEHEIKTNEKTEERLIQTEKGSYYLIESPSQIERRIEKNPKDSILNFVNCIFLIETSIFHDKCFDVTVSFNNSVFEKTASFYNTTFIGSTEFKNTLFCKSAVFTQSKFFQNVDFREAKFIGRTSFHYIEFHGFCNFNEIKFKNDVYFSNSIFSEEVRFINSKFVTMASFHQAMFNNKVKFTNIEIGTLYFSNVMTKDNFSIDLKYAKIREVDYTDTDFKNADNRETFLKLKELALSKHDHITALVFYQKEMLKHSEFLSKKKNVDFWILKFEHIVSDFGTNPKTPILIILNIAFSFSLFISLYLNEYTTIIQNGILFLNPTSSIENILKITTGSSTIKIPAFLEVFNFLKNILFGVLIYETIKSFRKFSRKL